MHVYAYAYISIHIQAHAEHLTPPAGWRAPDMGADAGTVGGTVGADNTDSTGIVATWARNMTWTAKTFPVLHGFYTTHVPSRTQPTPLDPYWQRFGADDDTPPVCMCICMHARTHACMCVCARARVSVLLMLPLQWLSVFTICCIKQACLMLSLVEVQRGSKFLG